MRRAANLKADTPRHDDTKIDTRWQKAIRDGENRHEMAKIGVKTLKIGVKRRKMPTKW
jgi:hypothetical protein